MKTQNKILLATTVTSIVVGALAGVGGRYVHREHRGSAGMAAASGAFTGLLAGMLVAAPFAMIFKDDEPSVGYLGAYIPEPRVVTYDNTMLRRYS